MITNKNDIENKLLDEQFKKSALINLIKLADNLCYLDRDKFMDNLKALDELKNKLELDT